MPLKDGYLYDLTPAELIAWVAQVTLATISTYTTRELIRIGWYNNPVVDKLYKLGSAGTWVVGVSTTGKAIVYDETANAALTNILTQVTATANATAQLASCIDTNRLKTVETP